MNTYIVKKILLFLVACFETFFMLFFIGSMLASSAFYYIIRIITWPFRFLQNLYFKVAGKKKKSLYFDGKAVR
ncbi:hypothetical protein [Flammeovirga sp. OC4]|uniref:hypothetical protein n=1 Tax=Flammeovirga sp. OC4 TaxID=1382345 RepID=UPI0012E0B532|nr:hypothetical protein [Flammeovirga sp. OC4]